MGCDGAGLRMPRMASAPFRREDWPAPSRPQPAAATNATACTAHSSAVITPSVAGDRPLEERQERPVGLDHRGHEVLLEHLAEHETEDRGRNGEAVLLHEPADQAQHQHDDDAIDRVGHRVGADDAEQQDDRHQHVARHAQELLGHLDRCPAERKHQQVGQDENEEHRIDELRILQEHRRARDSCPSCRGRRSRSP